MESLDAVKNSISQMDPTLTDLVLNPKSKKIARPPNAFMIFAREHRKSFACQNPNQNNKCISKLLGEAWRKVDARTKKMYYDKAKVLEDLHKQKFPDYAYSPRIARIQKIKRKIRKEQLKNLGSFPDDDEEAEAKHEMSCRAEDVKNDMKEQPNCEGKWNQSPEYVPNNPDYFANLDPTSNAVDREDPSLPFPCHEQTQSSCRSSCSSLCSGPDMRPGPYPDYPPYTPPVCSCHNCWKDRPFDSPCVNPHSRVSYNGDYMHPRAPGMDSYQPPLPTQYPCCQKAPLSTAYCPPDCHRNSFDYLEPKMSNHSYYGNMRWPQYPPWKAPTEDHFYHQNLDYYRTRSINCCNTNIPHHYPVFEHGSCYGTHNSAKCIGENGMQHFPPPCEPVRLPTNVNASYEPPSPVNHFTNGSVASASNEKFGINTNNDCIDSDLNQPNSNMGK